MFNKLTMFALNCVHTLKEMTTPNKPIKSIVLFKEMGYILLIFTISYLFIYYANNNSFEIKMRNISSLILFVSSGWFILNTMRIIKYNTNTLLIEKYKTILNKEIICMDETCCIPGNVNHYKLLLYLSICFILLIIFWQISSFYFDINSFYFVNSLLLFLAYAGFIHCDKRLYEISKLLGKKPKENNILGNESKFLSTNQEFFRLKFAFVSMPGFIGALLILIISLLLFFSSTNTDNYIINLSLSIAICIHIITNQISMRVIQLK